MQSGSTMRASPASTFSCRFGYHMARPWIDARVRVHVRALVLTFMNAHELEPEVPSNTKWANQSHQTSNLNVILGYHCLQETGFIAGLL